MAPQPTDRPSAATLRRVYTVGTLVAAGLFILHTVVIFAMVLSLSRMTKFIMVTVSPTHFGLLIILACFFILFITHIAEASVWALIFWKIREFSTFGESLYFAGTSLTALGYGDIVLQPPWRGLGPLMATNGILMFGCSTAFLFLVMQKLWEHL